MMGFYEFSSPYDWSRVADYRRIAAAAPGGIIDLSVGSPVDSVPLSVRGALTAASNTSYAYGYPLTAGTTDLRQAITDWMRDVRGVDLGAINAGIVPTVGSKEAVSLMASLLRLGPGDVVVQPRVSYPTYEIGTQLAGATVLKVDDVSDVNSWRSVPNVKAVWVNSPCNPTGEVLSAGWLSEIVTTARQIGAVVLSDECYALMDWRGGERFRGGLTKRDNWTQQSPLTSPCALNPQVCENTANGILVLYSLSKQSNMAGYRAAFIVGDHALVNRMTTYRRQIGQIVPGPVQDAMATALRDADAAREQWNRYHNRLIMLVDALRDYGYNVSMPQGALYVWAPVRSEDCWHDMDDLARIGIVPSPGEFYGASDHVRFSVTASDDKIAAAAHRLRSA